MKAWALAAAFFCAVLLQQGGGAVAVQADDEARIRALLGQLERALRTNDPDLYQAVLAPSADQTRTQNFAALEFRPGATRVVVHERDRQPLVGTLPGNRLSDSSSTRSSSTATARGSPPGRSTSNAGRRRRVADRRPGTAVDRSTTCTGCRSTPRRQFAARELHGPSEDLELTLVEGFVFTVDTDQGITGLVLIGRGEMRFSPTPETEKGQVRIFTGDTRRSNRGSTPRIVRVGAIGLHADPDELVAAAGRSARAAAGRGDLPRGIGEVVRPRARRSDARRRGRCCPAAGDFLAEVRTRRFDTLTYARCRIEAEDISRVRSPPRSATSPSTRRRRSSPRAGRFYNEDDLAAYDVLDYDIDMARRRPIASGSTGARTLPPEGARALDARQLTLRLAELAGRALGRQRRVRPAVQPARDGTRTRCSSTCPCTLLRDTELTLTVTYSGRLAPQAPERETRGAVQQDRSAAATSRPDDRVAFRRAEPSYPVQQPELLVSAGADHRLRDGDGSASPCPPRFGCVATGEPVPGLARRRRRRRRGAAARRSFSSSPSRPVRYLAFIVSRFARADRATVAFDDVATAGTAGGRRSGRRRRPRSAARSTTASSSSVEANPRQVAARPRAGRARGRRRAVLRVAHRRLAVSELHARAGRERAARRPQPGVLRRAEPAAAEHAAALAQRSGRLRGLPGVLPRPRDRASVVGTGGRLAELPRAVAERRIRAVLRRAVRAAPARRRGVRRRAAADAQVGASTDRTRARSISATGSATSATTAASSARSSTTRAPRSCTCCGASSATRRSSAGSAASTSTSRFRRRAPRTSAPAMEAETGRLARAVLRALDLRRRRCRASRSRYRVEAGATARRSSCASSRRATSSTCRSRSRFSTPIAAPATSSCR